MSKKQRKRPKASAHKPKRPQAPLAVTQARETLEMWQLLGHYQAELQAWRVAVRNLARKPEYGERFLAAFNAELEAAAGVQAAARGQHSAVVLDEGQGGNEEGEGGAEVLAAYADSQEGEIIDDRSRTPPPSDSRRAPRAPLLPENPNDTASMRTVGDPAATIGGENGSVAPSNRPVEAENEQIAAATTPEEPE